MMTPNVQAYPTPRVRLRGVPKAEERSDEAGKLSSPQLLAMSEPDA
jgi:hypothetical protein